MWDKHTFRQHIAEQKRLVAADTLSRQSARLMEQIEAHPLFLQAKTVLLFWSLPDEPCTHSLVQKYASRKKILLPVVRGKEMELRCFTGLGEMQHGAFGILEPASQPVFADLSQIDLAVVPGVAFDDYGRRLGRGGGYYDRFFSLPETRNIYKLGICFDFQRQKTIPVSPHDKFMDEVLVAY